MSESVETTVVSEEQIAAPEPAINDSENTPSGPSRDREARISELIGAIKESKELQVNENLTSDENHKIDYQQMVEGLSDDGQKFIGNLRRSYTQKTQELAEQRRQLESQAAELKSQREAMLKSDFHQNLRETAEQDAPIDMLDESSIEKRIEKEVARRINEMLQPMREEHAVQQRRIALQSFKSEHPDLEDYKHEIASELQNNEALNLEQAYWMVKGRSLAAQKNQQDEELQAYRTAARQAGLKVGGLNRGSRAGVPPNVKAQGAWAIYEYLHKTKK